MKNTVEAELLLTTRDATGRGLRSATSNVRSASAEMGAAFMRLAGGIAVIDTARRALIAMGTSAIETDRQVTQIGVTAGATAGEIDRMEQSLALAASGAKTSSRELASSVDGLVTAGLALDTATASAPTIAKTARATRTAIEDVNAATVALINNLRFTPDNLERAMDMLVTGGKLGSFEVKDMAREFPGMAASAAKLGFEGERGLAAIVAMSQVVRESTATGGEAATQLTDFMEKLASPDVTKNLKKFGVDTEKVFREAKGDGVEFVRDMLTEIRRLSAGDPFAMAQIFGDKEARAAATALTKDLGRLDAMMGQVKNSAGSMMTDFQRQTEGAAGAVDRLSASWTTWLDTLSRSRRGPIAKGAGIAADVLDRATADMTEAEVFGDTFAAVLGREPNIRDRSYGNDARRQAELLGLPPDATMQAIADAALLRAGGKAVREGKLSLDAFESLSRGPELRADRRSREEASRFTARGGNMTDAEIDTRIQNLLGERKSIEAENASVDGAGRGMVLEMNREWLDALEVELAKVRGFARARGLQSGSDAGGPVEAVVKEPLKVEVGKGTVDVRIRVDGPGTIVGVSSSSAGNIITNVGTSMPGAGRSVPRRDE